MLDLLSRRDFTAVRAARQAWVLAVVVVLALVGISVLASADGAPRAAARAVPVRNAPPPAPGTETEALAGSEPTRSPATAGSDQAGPAVAAVRPAAVHTMSMDARIQGGLTAHQEQAVSARLRSAHQDVATAPGAASWTPAMGRSAVARATSWLGMPYSWAGGDATGPTAGRCVPDSGGDLDCHVIGFDCSGLVMYAWGEYAALPHLADAQRGAGAFHPTRQQLRPGDLVFFSGYLPGGTGHVAIYTGAGKVVEAPQSGSVVRRSTLTTMLAEDGVYRGAVRPLTGATPVLAAPHVPVPTAGGLVTLHGTHLANANAAQIGGVTVRRFVQHSDSEIAFRAPAHTRGGVALTVSTPWQARSRAVTLTYARPRPAPPATGPTTTPPPSTAPVSLGTPPPSKTLAPPPPSETRPSSPVSTTRPPPAAPSESPAPGSGATSSETPSLRPTTATGTPAG